MVLILAVFAVALLLVLSVGLSTAVRAELLASRTSLERMQSLFLAEAGINQARAILLYEDVTVDTLEDPWAVEAEGSLDQPQAVGEAGYRRVRVYDACGRIDINAADFATLAQLTGDPGIANAILDWRGQGTLEGYYRSLPYPYLPRRGPFQSPGELLLVEGVTPDLYYGTWERPGLVDLITVTSESLNTDAEGERRIGLNEFRAWDEPSFRKMVEERLGDALELYDLEVIWKGFARLVESGQDGYTSLSQLATVAGLSYDKIVRAVDDLTADSTNVLRGRVNVNTAPVEVLAAMPGGSRELAEAIVSQRESQPFTSLSEVAELIYNGGGGQQAFELMIDHVTTKSSCFIIESMGYTQAGRGYRTLRALVRRTRQEVRCLRQTEEEIIRNALEEARGDKLAAASRLGISKSSMYAKIEQYGIRVATA